MNKFTFFLLSAIAAITLASEASALPLFARQTGMECSACHFQHFPMLTSFGRAFKSGAYTMMGAQAQIEGPKGDNLSIPENLNMAVLTTLGYEKSNMATGDSSTGTLNTGNGQFYVPGNGGELSLFFGGRINGNAGFLSEIGMAGGAGLGSAKMPILFEVSEGTRAGFVPFTTDGQGASYGFEVLNTGANAVHQMSPVGGINDAHTHAISAQQYIGTGSAAMGLAFVVNSSMGFINLTKFNQTLPGDGNAGTAAKLGSTYARLAGTFDVAGWDSGVGIQSWSGSSYNSDTAFAAVIATKATAIDGQMQGELGGMPVGFYASYAKAPVDAIDSILQVSTNIYNGGGTLDRSSFNVSCEVGVLPAVATLGAAIRRANSGVDEGLNDGGPATGANATDNAIMLTATYKLSQNMMASLSFTKNSGSFWNQANIDATGSKTTTFSLFTLF
jgi:hypothetical protein